MTKDNTQWTAVTRACRATASHSVRGPATSALTLAPVLVELHSLQPPAGGRSELPPRDHAPKLHCMQGAGSRGFWKLQDSGQSDSHAL